MPPYTPLIAALALVLSYGGTLQSSSPGSESTRAAEREAVLLTDFTDPDCNARWTVVNDNVMGGRSDGEMAFDESGNGTMVLTGDINTNGGGFTSVRMAVEPDMFDRPEQASIFRDLRAVRLRIRADKASLDKPFAIRLEDTVSRRLGINFRATLPIDQDADPQQWQIVTVPIDRLRPVHHGRQLDPAKWSPLDTSRLNRIGIMLNNVGDGPYRLEVDFIELLR